MIYEAGECEAQARGREPQSLSRGCCFGEHALGGREGALQETVTATGGGCRCLHLTSTQFQAAVVRARRGLR